MYVYTYVHTYKFI